MEKLIGNWELAPVLSNGGICKIVLECTAFKDFIGLASDLGILISGAALYGCTTFIYECSSSPFTPRVVISFSDNPDNPNAPSQFMEAMSII